MVQQEPPLTSWTLVISGMHCTECEEKVRERLLVVEDVRAAAADHERGTANVQFELPEPPTERLERAIEELGYQLERVERAS